eukprot:scpid67126/ scgid23938/ Elongation of very long chain fatty acids protein 6; 3-keto acyl-CoA synthase elovl6; ELOVL fatty acid elongase 6
MAFLLQFDGYLNDMEERFYDAGAARSWARDVTPYALCIVVAYLSLVFLGVRWMKDRPPFSLRRTLVLWNVGLAWFSMFGTWRVVQFAARRTVQGRWIDVICDKESFEAHEGGLWSFIFALSKFVEFGDTAFIVLRKKKLTLLHWYHHASVLLYCWFGFIDAAATGKLFGLLNLIVHSMMYTYYSITATGMWRIPSYVNIIITSTQLLQMALGIVATSIAYYRRVNNTGCDVSYTLIYAAFAMYASYLVLFINFFYKTYISKKPKTS